MQFNTFFCSSTKKFSPTGFLIQCMTSRQRLLKVFRQRSSSSRSGQWQMSHRGRSKTACPGKTTMLWSACRGELFFSASRGKNKIIFILQYGTVRSKPTTNLSMHYKGPNSRRSLRYRQFISAWNTLMVFICICLSQEELGSIPCARCSHLHGTYTWIERKCNSVINHRLQSTDSVINGTEKTQYESKKKNRTDHVTLWCD